MAVQSDLKKFLPQEMLQVLGKNLPGIIQSINNSHEKTEQLIQACIDQLFLTTASGKYLVQLGEEKGFIMPPNSGLDIRSYRVLVPIMVSNPKQVRFTIDELIKAFYGSSRVRANISASVIGPYSLQDGDDLIIETEKGQQRITILGTQVSNINDVSATEISAIFNAYQSDVLAESVFDRASNNYYLRLTTSTIGAGGFIRIVGGTLQNVLKIQELINTTNVTGTNWTIDKYTTYTDVTKFTWDGAGTNPNIYLVKAGDIVTIRGFIDGSNPYSNLNGSYEVVDSGYDYFVIKNDLFDVISSSYTQTEDNNIVFTSDKKHSIFDLPEYAHSSENEPNVITITVPAVPPLAKRFLKGSAHIHGFERNIIDFTRATVQIDLPSDEVKPTDVNLFHIRNKHQRYDFTNKFYETLSSDSAPQPTYAINASSEERSVFPYTINNLINSNPVYGTVGSNRYKLTFPYKHGLIYSWGFTLTGGTGAGNITSPDLNKEHQVAKVLNDRELEFYIKDSSGYNIPFEGIAWASADVYRQSATQSDGSDFYLKFASSAAATASGLTEGTLFRLSPSTGTNVDPFFGVHLRFSNLIVTSVNNDQVNFAAGYGVGPNGLIISSITGVRSGYFGGSLSYRLDKTSDINQERVLTDLRGIFVNYTPEANPNYLGPYLFDPTGEKTNVTVSKYVIELNTSIRRGDNFTILSVSNGEVDVSEFPQSGQLVIGYGTDKFEGPIRFNAVISGSTDNQIIIDPAYKFKYSHDIGSNIQYIHGATQYIPTMDGADYPFYLTGTSEARDTLFALVELLEALGIFQERSVVLPDLRYADPSISPYA